MNETDKETVEVMNCLLSMSKAQTNQYNEVQYWENCESEQIIWKIDSDGTLLQEVPVEYKIEKPVTYVVTQSVLKNEPDPITGANKVVLIQELPQETAHYADLQFVQSPVYEQGNVIAEQEPNSSRTDSSYSGSIDVEVDDVDQLDEQPQPREIQVANFRSPTVKKNKNKGLRKGSTRKNSKSPSKKVKRKDAAKDDVNTKLRPPTARVRDDEFTKLEDDWQQVEQRFKRGCECSSNCFDGMNPEKVFRHHLNIADLTKAEHDMYLMGNILASQQNPEETCRKGARLRMRTAYSFHGKKVCQTAFLYLEHVTLYHMKRLRQHVQNHGVSPRIHGNHGRKPSNTLPLDIYQHATQFVHKFIEMNHVNSVSTTNKPSYYRLPADCTKKSLHDEYKIYCEKSMTSSKSMQYSTFTNFFKKQFPNVKFRKVDRHDKKNEDFRDYSNEKSGRNKKRIKTETVLQTVEPIIIENDPYVIVQDCEPTVLMPSHKK